MSPKTLYDKIWDAHVAHVSDDGTTLLYIDRHLVHEVTSAQAFEGLRIAGRKVHAPDKTIAVPDHNVPTTQGREDPAQMTEESRIQVAALDTNAKEFGVHYYPVSDVRQGIVHIVGPEQGWTLPGMTVVCGDSHTATHGAFGSLAHGIGTSEVEHVLATQTLIQKKSKNMKVEITGKLKPGVTAKDITLAVIGETGTAGGTGYAITRSYYTMEGAPIEPSSMAVGDRFVTVLRVNPFEDSAARLMINDPLPAGIEIDNPSLLRSGDVAALDWLALSEAAHTEFRSDRFLAAVDMRTSETVTLAYVARAVTSGNFHHPAASVEDMYRPRFRARTATGRMTVTR